MIALVMELSLWAYRNRSSRTKRNGRFWNACTSDSDLLTDRAKVGIRSFVQANKPGSKVVRHPQKVTAQQQIRSLLRITLSSLKSSNSRLLYRPKCDVVLLRLPHHQFMR